MTYFSSC